MFKVTYLMDISWYDTFEELKKYYGYPEAKDLDELNELLEDEAGGMAFPIIEEKDF